MEQDKDIIPETVIKFLQTVLTGKTDYSQPLNIVEQLTNCRHWWQDQTTKTHHVSFAVKCLTGNNFYTIDAYHGLTGLWCFIHTNCGNWHGTVPSKPGRIPHRRGIAKKHLPSIHHASMGQYRPLGGDDQWRGHIAPGQFLCNPESSDQYHNVIWSEPRQTGPGCQVKNLKWLLTRMSNPKEDQAISSWTGFNTPSTVNEDPTQTLTIMETQGLKESVCVFDQVFYVKTAESLGSMINSRTLYSEWYHSIPYHTIPFETSYIDHWKEVSGCWPPRLVCGVWCAFRRIDYWCDGRAHIQSCWQASQNHVRCGVEASSFGYMSIMEQRFAIWKNVLKSISTFHDEVSHTSFTSFIDDASRSRMLLLFKDHVDTIGNSNPLTAYWTSYHDMAEITLGLLIAAR